MTRVLLAGQDWQARALLRAQLLEEGVDVEAFEIASEAINTVGDVLPGLLIADISSSDQPNAEIELLAQWADQFPIWIIAAHSIISAEKLKGRGFEMIFFKPVDVGEFVKQVAKRVENS